jgi:hypothetical protein
MLPKRALTHVLLALALLVGQQAVFAHTATHLGKPRPAQDQQLPHTKVCEQCVQGAQFSSALLDMAAPSSVIWVPSLGHLADGTSAQLPAFIRAFSSRAPPASL